MHLPLNQQRVDYQLSQLSETSLNPNPILQFEQWFSEVLDHKITEANAMTLSTISSAGWPHSRIVLLKDVTDQGFFFYTNYMSQKGKDIAFSNKVSLVFFWKELERQVCIIGTASKTTVQNSDAYFSTRPVKSQIAAIVSMQSTVMVGREGMEQQFSHIEKNMHSNSKLERPAHWGGYVVEPSQMEFWQGRSNRLHDRIIYSKNAVGQWIIERLMP